ncbi:M17 family metallopeptidase [Mesomycoplasma moatsii]|uniref:M17 family metallopeptidase n=1 Tax=Mesomycoplasma moatsii TaxID=171287 RepID=UPI0003B32D0F
MIHKFIVNSKINKAFLLKAQFKEDKQVFLKKENYILDNPEKEISTIYLGSKANFDLNKLISILRLIVNNNERIYQIDASTFKNKKITIDDVTKNFIYIWYEVYGKQFNLKTKKIKDNLPTYLLINKFDAKFNEDILIASQMCEIKTLQDSAPNILTVNKFIKYIQNLCKKNNFLKLTILDKKELQKLNMNLIIGVNQGSEEDVKVAIIEYKGSISKEKTTFVGKGIMFDSGGYNLKTPGKYMLDMKYDMSGAAISILLVDTIAKLKIKKNVSCIVPLTDNMIDSLAQLPESILTSMSGKSVEVANTDAEGRLILADAITYAAKKLDSSLIIDLSTLTGTIIYALGKYTGAWTTKDNHWNLLEKAAKKENELIWRMPINDIYLETLNKNTFADTLSCSNIDKPDSNIAATWLKQFAINRDYIHLDIAGSADINSKGQAPMFRTLIEFIKNL